MGQYRYRNAYPTGSCSLSWSAWGERLPSDTRELERGWLVEESRAAASATSSKRVKRTKTTATARNSASKG